MDHLNINHEKGRHDLLKHFYFETLGFAIDPRKEENILKERKGLWANAGITQLHLGEGEPHAQIVDGYISIAYKSVEDLETVRNKLISAQNTLLKTTAFTWSEREDELLVTDPWGSHFRLLVDSDAEDPRGCQPGSKSLPVLIPDLTFYVNQNTDLTGISRFYRYVFDTPSLQQTSAHEVKIVVSPFQTLSFRHTTEQRAVDHTELEIDSSGKVLANSGPHISLYVKDMPSCFKKAQELGGIFVNNRFKRQASNLEEAIDQCMFRLLDIIDPEDKSKRPLFRLEHEVRSIVNRDGSKYKSCPLTIT